MTAFSGCSSPSQFECVYILAVAEQAVGQQLGLLPVGGSHVVFAVSLLEGFADPDSPELTDQRVLPRQPTLVIFHYDADNLRKKRDKEETSYRSDDALTYAVFRKC